MESAHPVADEAEPISRENEDHQQQQQQQQSGMALTGAGEGGGGAGGGGSSVLPAPITEPVLPARTRLQEAGAEVAVYYSQIEGQVYIRQENASTLRRRCFHSCEIRNTLCCVRIDTSFFLVVYERARARPSEETFFCFCILCCVGIEASFFPVVHQRTRARASEEASLFSF